MKIRYKLAAGFTIGVLLVTTVGVVSLWQLCRVARPLRKDLPEAITAAHCLHHQDSRSQLIRYYDEVLTQSARDFAFTQDTQWQQRYRDAEPKLDAAIKDALRDADEEDRELLARIDQANLALVGMEHQSMQLAQAGRTQEAVAVLDSREYWDQKAVYQKGLLHYVQQRVHESEGALDASVETIRAANRLAERAVRASVLWVLGAVIAGVVLSTGIGAIVFRGISRPLERLRAAAAALGRGDLHVDLDITSRDEMGQLAASFVAMAENLRHTTASVDSLHREIAERQRAAAALQESDAEYRSLFENMLDGFAYCEMLYDNDRPQDFVYRKVNDAFEALTGLTDVVGKRVTEVVPGIRESNPELFEIYGRVASTGKPERFETCLPTMGWLSISVHSPKRGYFVAVFENTTELRRTAEELRRSEERLRRQTGLLTNVLSHTPNFVFWKDRDSVYLGCNEVFAQSAGLAGPEDIVGKTDYDLPWRNEADFYRSCDKQVMDSGEPLLDFEEDQTQRGDRQITLLTSKVPLRDASGCVIGVLGIYSDITERKHAEEALRKSQAQLSNAMEIAKLGAWELDIESDVFTFTDSFYALFHTTAKDMGGYQMPVAEYARRFVYPEDAPLVSLETHKALETDDPDFSRYLEHRMLYANGSVGYIAVRFFIVKDHRGRTIKTYGVNQDITERKQVEQKQAQLLEQLTAANQDLRDFAYVVSHDLKAPLRAIRTLADWLATDYQDKLDEQGRESLQLLGGRVDRMQSLIDGVLQYSRVGRTEQTMACVTLSEVVPEIIATLGAPEHISIRIENDLPTIEADPTRITQVFQNLLSNAIKYMDKPHGEIEVNCVEEGGFWKFGVRDNGPGIEERHFERIFKLFQTLAPRDSNESTGVGLTITKKIVEMYGGTIWVESEVGRGSTFFFTLPRSKMEVRDAQTRTDVACAV